MGIGRIVILSACVSSLLLSAAMAETGSGVLAGVVTGPGGKGLGELAVAYWEQPSKGRTGALLVHGMVRTQYNGVFSVANLPPATYQVCVDARGRGYLDPCMWSSSKPMATVTSGKAASGFTIKLEQGTTLKVRVKDPKGLLAQHENKGEGSHFLVGVRCPSGLLQTGRVVSTDAVGRDIEMLVPLNQALKVAVMTQRFDTSDDSGKQLGLASSDLDVSLSKGQQSPVVNITITGIH